MGVLRYAIVIRTNEAWNLPPACFNRATEALEHVLTLPAGEEPGFLICDLQAESKLKLTDLRNRAAKEEFEAALRSADNAIEYMPVAAREGRRLTWLSRRRRRGPQTALRPKMKAR